jgi:hypothetical protein
LHDLSLVLRSRFPRWLVSQDQAGELTGRANINALLLAALSSKGILKTLVFKQNPTCPKNICYFFSSIIFHPFQPCPYTNFKFSFSIPVRQ